MKVLKYPLIFIFSLVLLNAQEHKISTKILEKLKNENAVDVLLYLKHQSNLSGLNAEWSKEQKGQYVHQQLIQTAQTYQINIIEKLKSLGVSFKSFYIINAIHTQLNKEQIIELARMNEIDRILYDENYTLEPTLDQTALQLQSRGPNVTWGIQRIGADLVWNLGYEGQGVTVAGEDTGYRWDLPGIKSKYRGWNGTSVDHNYNWHDGVHKISPLSSDSLNPCGLSLKEPCDDHGHGSHTMGTMTGRTDDEWYGIAPKAKWIGCRNMERGNGAPSTYIECFEFFLAPTDLDGNNPKPELAPHVINNSWYCSKDEGCDTSNFKLMQQVIINLRKAGIVVVVSAGNDGQSCGTIANPPAMFEESFVVGSFAINDTISNFSSIGPVKIDGSNRIKPNVVAPGSDVVSQVLDGSFQAWNGTSMAGPHVAGLVALIISANPSLAGKVEVIEDIIEMTARYQESNTTCDSLQNNAIPNHVYGFGKIQADAAVRRAIILKAEDEQKIKFGLSISPNPARQNILIKTTKEHQSQTLQIFNLLGTLIYEKPIFNETTNLDISHLIPSAYVIKIKNTNAQLVWIKE